MIRGRHLKFSQEEARVASSQGLQEIHDRVDLLLGQNPVSSERRHHGLRIAFGLIVNDRHQIVTIRISAFDVLEFRADAAGEVAARDHMAGQAIALAAVECDFLTLGGVGLCGSGTCDNGRTDQQGQRPGGLRRRNLGGLRRTDLGQGRFPQASRLFRPIIGGRVPDCHQSPMQTIGSRRRGKPAILAINYPGV